jgi:hypothetical protein
VVGGFSVAWVGPRSEVPLTRTGPHSRTHTVPIKHAVPPLTHAHNMCGAYTRHVHATCAHPRAAHTQRLHAASPATASLTETRSAAEPLKRSGSSLLGSICILRNSAFIRMLILPMSRQRCANTAKYWMNSHKFLRLSKREPVSYFSKIPAR